MVQDPNSPHWQDSPAQASQISSVGLAQNDCRESAVFIALPASANIVVISGKNDTIGVALPEVYVVDYPLTKGNDLKRIATKTLGSNFIQPTSLPIALKNDRFFMTKKYFYLIHEKIDLLCKPDLFLYYYHRKSIWIIYILQILNTGLHLYKLYWEVEDHQLGGKD